MLVGVLPYDLLPRHNSPELHMATPPSSHSLSMYENGKKKAKTMTTFVLFYFMYVYRPVGRGVAGMARATPTFGRFKPESTVGHPNFSEERGT